jgi:hypothetical protein
MVPCLRTAVGVFGADVVADIGQAADRLGESTRPTTSTDIGARGALWEPSVEFRSVCCSRLAATSLGLFAFVDQCSYTRR